MHNSLLIKHKYYCREYAHFAIGSSTHLQPTFTLVYAGTHIHS